MILVPTVFAVHLNSTSAVNLSNYDAILSTSVSLWSCSSTDRTRQSITFGSSLLNQVDCTKTPNCSLLNRKNCYSTPNTCGDCLNDNFAGVSGDSNGKCVSLISMNGECSGSTICLTSKDCKDLDQSNHLDVCSLAHRIVHNTALDISQTSTNRLVRPIIFTAERCVATSLDMKQRGLRRVEP